jgi:L-alanine-DL-glutamate epimerase-like enolase superfamily enzyme
MSGAVALAADPIAAVEAYDSVVPLPRPLTVGPATVAGRSYAVVRVRTEDGVEGGAYAYGRGLPIAAIVERSLAPLLVGLDAARPEHARAALAAAYWPYAERGLFAVAASAVDLALWDALGKRLGAPLADLLGRRVDEVPVCGVAGYVRPGVDPVASIQEDLATLVELGCRAFKLTLGAADAATDARRVAAAREVVGPDAPLVADAFRSFAGLEDALRRVRLLEPFGLSYLEDPFAESAAPLVAELRRRTGILVGLGETLNGHRAFRELLEADAVDVVRCDALAVGGVRELVAVAALASARGLPLSTHVHTEVHVHFAATLANLHPAGLEWNPPQLGLDMLHELLAEPLELQDGCARVPARPGLGLEFDWRAVERYDRG